MGNKIVIAEDEQHIARLVMFKLEREGFEVIWAKDGGEAVSCVREQQPDLVLLDIMMPVMDGYDVLKTLKGDEKLKDIPVIMLTAKGQEQDVLKGFDLGTEDYIVKPFRPAELAARIKKVLKN